MYGVSSEEYFKSLHADVLLLSGSLRENIHVCICTDFLNRCQAEDFSIYQLICRLISIHKSR